MKVLGTHPDRWKVGDTVVCRGFERGVVLEVRLSRRQEITRLRIRLNTQRESVQGKWLAVRHCLKLTQAEGGE